MRATILLCTYYYVVSRDLPRDLQFRRHPVRPIIRTPIIRSRRLLAGTFRAYRHYTATTEFYKNVGSTMCIRDVFAKFDYKDNKPAKMLLLLYF